MCNFKSAICVKDESVKRGFRLLFSPWTESHSDLCKIYKLAETDKRIDMAKVEFSPPSMDTAHLVDGYKLKIDEERTPDWFDAEKQERVSDMLRAYVKSCIVSGDVDLLIGGQFIVAPGAKIACAREMVITAMCGGTLSEMWGGTLSAMCGGTLSAMRGGTLSEMWGGTLSAMWGGTLSAISKYFDGLLGKIGERARVLSDNREAKK